MLGPLAAGCGRLRDLQYQPSALYGRRWPATALLRRTCGGSYECRPACLRATSTISTGITANALEQGRGRKNRQAEAKRIYGVAMRRYRLSLCGHYHLAKRKPDDATTISAAASVCAGPRWSCDAAKRCLRAPRPRAWRRSTPANGELGKNAEDRKRNLQVAAGPGGPTHSVALDTVRRWEQRTEHLQALIDAQTDIRRRDEWAIQFASVDALLASSASGEVPDPYTEAPLFDDTARPQHRCSGSAGCGQMAYLP